MPGFYSGRSGEWTEGGVCGVQEKFAQKFPDGSQSSHSLVHSTYLRCAASHDSQQEFTVHSFSLGRYLLSTYCVPECPGLLSLWVSQIRPCLCFPRTEFSK